MIINLTWDEYFLNITKAVALKSKDKSNQIGAIIVGPDHEIRSTGYNGPPRGFDDTKAQSQPRPDKYKYFEHAERNAIYNAARFGMNTMNCTLYCLWPPCTDCARAIIQSGISKLVTLYKPFECPERWQADMIIAHKMLCDCKVSTEPL